MKRETTGMQNTERETKNRAVRRVQLPADSHGPAA